MNDEKNMSKGKVLVKTRTPKINRTELDYDKNINEDINTHLLYESSQSSLIAKRSGKTFVDSLIDDGPSMKLTPGDYDYIKRTSNGYISCLKRTCESNRNARHINGYIHQEFCWDDYVYRFVNELPTPNKALQDAKNSKSRFGLSYEYTWEEDPLSYFEIRDKGKPQYINTLINQVKSDIRDLGFTNFSVTVETVNKFTLKAEPKKLFFGLMKSNDEKVFKIVPSNEKIKVLHFDLRW